MSLLALTQALRSQGLVKQLGAACSNASGLRTFATAVDDKKITVEVGPEGDPQ